MAIKFKILIIASILTIFNVFSYGQSSDLGAVCAESLHYYGVDGFTDSEFIWAVETGTGVIIAGEGTDTVAIQWGYNTGSYLIEVVEVSSSGCRGTTSSGIVEVSAPDINLGFDSYEICDGDSITFDVRGDYTVQWHDSTYAYTYTATNSEFIVARASFMLNGRECVRYDSLDFVVHDLPTVDLGGDTVLCDNGDPLTLYAGDGYAIYEWKRNGNMFLNNPFIVYPSDKTLDTLTVVVTDNNGCQMSDTLLILPCSVYELFAGIPNTITPNNDGLNDVWEIKYIDQFPNAELEVFDRWGRLVWRSSDVANDLWDGTSKGKAVPMDAYYFVLSLNFLDFEPISGTINVIR